MTDVEPRLKDKIDCPCDKQCGRYGTPLRNGHVKGCPCRRCLGRRNKAKGRRKQSAAARAVGIPRSNLAPGHEEHFGGALRVEVKAGAQVGPIDTRYRNARAQSDQSRSIGDNRPFAFLAMPDGQKHGYVVVRTDELKQVLLAVAENWGLL